VLRRLTGTTATTTIKKRHGLPLQNKSIAGMPTTICQNSFIKRKTKQRERERERERERPTMGKPSEKKKERPKQKKTRASG